MDDECNGDISTVGRKNKYNPVARGYEFIVEERIIDGVQQHAAVKPRVLIVDDEPMAILEILLERAGYQCVKVLVVEMPWRCLTLGRSSTSSPLTL